MSTSLPTVGLAPAPTWFGIYAAVVQNTNDPLGENRVQLLVPQVLGMTATNWAEPLALTSGSSQIPAVGTYVLAMFIGGDINRPCYIPNSYTPSSTPGSGSFTSLTVTGASDLEGTVTGPDSGTWSTTGISAKKLTATISGASVTGGMTTDTFTVTSTSGLEGTVTGPDSGTWSTTGISTKELTATSGGLSVTGGTTTDTLLVSGGSTMDGQLNIVNDINFEKVSSITGPGNGVKVYVPSATGTALQLYTQSLWQGVLSSAYAADFTHYTVTAASATQCSKAWSIPANDAQVGTTYRLTLAGNGTQGSTAQGLFFETSGGFAETPLAASFVGTSTAFFFKVVFEITVITTGSSGTCNVSGTAIAGGSEASVGFTQAAAFNTTSAFTFEIESFWSSTTGTPTMTCYQSYLERLGP